MSRNMRNISAGRHMRGFVLTLDVFLALMLLTLVMLMVLSQDYSSRQSSAISMRAFSMEMLASLEKSGALARSIGDPPHLRQSLNGLQPNICARMTLMNSSGATLVDVQKQGCARSGDFYVLYRSFYTKGELYTAKSEVWLR